MVTVQYIKDLLDSFKTGVIPYPLSEYANFDDNATIEIKEHQKVANCNIIQAKNADPCDRALYIRLFEGFSAYEEIPVYIIIDVNFIYLYNSKQNEKYELTKDSLFNFNLEYNVPFTEKDLLDIQEKYIEVLDTDIEFNDFSIFYTSGEEEYYGY